MSYLFMMSAIFSQQEYVEPNIPLCGSNPNTQALAALIINHPSQKRQELSCNELLVEIADKRAKSLLNDPTSDNITANQFVIKNGFRFASYYPVTGNQVEAVANKVELPEKAFEYLISSDKHHDHVLGYGDFFERQTQIGVGFYQSELNQTQYVVLIAEPYSSPKIVYKQEFKKPTLRTVTDCPRDWRRSTNRELKKVCREMADREKKQQNQ
jgi:hypothetical protein